MKSAGGKELNLRMGTPVRYELKPPIKRLTVEELALARDDLIDGFGQIFPVAVKVSRYTETPGNREGVIPSFIVHIREGDESLIPIASQERIQLGVVLPGFEVPRHPMRGHIGRPLLLKTR
jgi:hypothetical protein